MQKIIGHVDMDCFFCACEVKRTPILKGKPVMVGATGTRGVVAAANYEARKHGVFSATPIARARQLCPEGIFLPPDFHLYSKESKQVMQILSPFAGQMEQMSVDEAYLDVTETVKQFPTVQDFAEAIQKTVLEKTQLTCSVGIAPSRSVAKIASDFKKPKGITVVDDVFSFLAPLPIEKFPGIGKISKHFYHEHGIKIFHDIQCMNRFTVLETFGKYGVYVQQIAKGEIADSLHQYGPQKSVSREVTFMEDCSKKESLLSCLKELCQEVYDDLGAKSYRTVSLKLRFADFRARL